MNNYQDDINYVKGLYERYPYINQKNIEKVFLNIYRDKYSNNDYYSDQLLDEIYIVLSSANTYIANHPDDRARMVDSRERVMEVINAKMTENISFLEKEIYRLEREYKMQKNDSLADIKEDLYNDVDLLDFVKQITETNKDLHKALRYASKHQVENFVKYYNYSLSLAAQKNALTLFNSTEGVLWGTSFQYLGSEFINKKAFKVESDEFLWLYQKLEQCIEDFDIESASDPKFEDFKDAYIKDIILFDEKGSEVHDDSVTIEVTDELKQTILNYANEQCNNYCLLRDYLEMWMPRALSPMEDGCFIVTREEVENHVNIAAITTLKFEYSVIFDFFKKMGIEISLTDNVRDLALYYLQGAEVSIEDLNAVYKRTRLDYRNPITYKEISKEFIKMLEDNGVKVEEEAELG